MSGLPFPVSELPVYRGAIQLAEAPEQPVNGRSLDLVAAERDGANDGQRNDTLYRLTCKLLGQRLHRDEVWRRLEEANARSRPPLDLAELEKLFRSAEGWWNSQARPESRPECDELRERFAEGRTAASRFLQSDPPPREELVEGLLPKGVAGLLVAGGGTGKGFFQLLLALCLTTGSSFGPFTVPRAFRAVVISLEDNAAELHRRLRAVAVACWGATWGHKLAEMAAERLQIVDLVGCAGAALGNTFVEVVAEAAAGCDAIFLDPLGKGLPPGVELNAQEGAGEVHRWLDRIVRATGATVFVAHHATKAALSGGQLSAEAATGSRMLVDLSRVVLTLRALDEEEARTLGLPSRGSYVQLGLAKSNYTPGLHSPVIFRRVEGGALEHAHADRASDRNRDLALKALCMEPHRWLTKEELRERFQHLGGRYRDFDRTRQALIDDPNDLAETREVPGRRGGRAKRFYAPAERLRTADDWPETPEENPTQSVAKQSDAASNEISPPNQDRGTQGELLENDSMQAHSGAAESSPRDQRETNRLQESPLRGDRRMQPNPPVRSPKQRRAKRRRRSHTKGSSK